MNSEAEIYGRKLLAEALADLSAIGHKARHSIPNISASDFSAGIIAGMVVLAKHFPFDAPAGSHLSLAEALIQSYLELTGETEALAKSKADLLTIKEKLYGTHQSSH